MTTLWAKTVSFDSVREGDELAILVKYVSQATIDLYARLASPGERSGWHNLHTDQEYARQGIFGGTVLMGVATVAYVAELMEKAFPIDKLMGCGSRLEMRATEPIRAGDTVTFTGRVTGKREEEGQRLVECEVAGTNQLGETVALARATIAF